MLDVAFAFDYFDKFKLTSKRKNSNAKALSPPSIHLKMITNVQHCDKDRLIDGSQCVDRKFTCYKQIRVGAGAG